MRPTRILLIALDVVILVSTAAIAGMGWLWYDYLRRRRKTPLRPYHLGT